MRTVNLTPAKVEGMRSPRRVLWAMGVVVLFLSATRAQSPTADYQVKAAFLFNFAKSWSGRPSSFSDPSAPLRISFWGAIPSAKRYATSPRKKVNGHKLEVSQVFDLRMARTCQILFIASSETA